MKLEPTLINDLCKLIPKADHFDFFAFRSGEISFEEFKLRALKIDKSCIVTRDDLIKQGVPLKYFIEADMVDQRIQQYNRENPKKPWTSDKPPKWIDMPKLRDQARKEAERQE